MQQTSFYRAFTRHEEAKYTGGADWDWFFVFSDGCVRLRVQAKKLFENKNNQIGLLKSNQHGFQIDKLISSAKKKGIFPMYAFFSTNTSPTASPSNPTNPEGAFLCGADIVLSKLATSKRNVTPSDALAYSCPLPHIACTLLKNSHSAKAFTQKLHNDFQYSGPLTKQGNPLGLSQTTPQFALDVLNRNGFFDGWEQEYESEFEDIDAIVIVDARA